MTSSSTPDIVFGAGGIGNTPDSFTYTWTTPDDVNSLLAMLQHNNITILDSAAMYPPGAPGDANRLLGLSHASAFAIDTKIGRPPTSTAPGLGNTLTRENIQRSIAEDLALLKAPKVRCLYAHAPDKLTPHVETAAAFDEQVRLGYCEFYGLCNYSTERLREYIQVCKDNGYALPAIYQGWYSAIHRFPEESGLLDLCREHGIKYYAYSPLSGGFLTGKVTAARTSASTSSTSASTTNTTTTSDNTAPADPSSVLYRTRFDPSSFMKQYTLMYDHPSIHAAMQRFKASCEQLTPPLTTAEASLRWLFFHSALRGGDGVILGAKRTEQLQDNLDQVAKGPLSVEAVQVVQQLWDETGGLIDGTLGFEG